MVISVAELAKQKNDDDGDQREESQCGRDVSKQTRQRRGAHSKRIAESDVQDDPDNLAYYVVEQEGAERVVLRARYDVNGRSERWDKKPREQHRQAAPSLKEAS